MTAAADFNKFLEKIQKLPQIKSKAAASLLGAAVADAAARPLHWIYDKDQLDTVLGEKRNTPEFWPQSKSPFYTLPTGDRSCYNHVVMVGLEAFILANGEPDLQVYQDVIRKHFGEGTAWQEALARRKEAYNPEKRLKWRQPVEGPWLHGAIIHLLDHGVRDEDNTEMDPFLLSMPHLLLKADQENVVEECIKISSLLTGRLEFVRTLATILQQIQLDGKIDVSDASMMETATTQEVLDRVNDGPDYNVDDRSRHINQVEKWGKNCHLPGSYQGALHAFLTHPSENKFAETIRSIILAGGCNCSRANYAAALIGAELGVSCLPLNWISKVNQLEKILNSIIKATEI